MTATNKSKRKDPEDQQADLTATEKKSKSRKRSLDQLSHNVRDCSSLYASPITVKCAQIHQCIPCAYKIGLFDVSLDSEFTKLVPNARPEQCPRSSTTDMIPNGTMGFQKGMAALTVGDGDFSYSLALARILEPKRSGSTVIATSYESKDTLQKTYPRFEEYSKELEALGARQYFNVDATKLFETLPMIKGCKFDRICWNFPCTAIANGQDGQNDAMEKNKDLVRQFVKDAKDLLSDCGEIHMCHKTKPPYNQWGLEQVALEWLPPNSLVFAGKVVLDRSLIPPYRPLKALDRKSFPCHDACFYIFRPVRQSENAKFPPTIDGDCDGVGEEGAENAERPTIPVTADIILSIRCNLLQVASAKPKRNNEKQKKKFRR